MVLQQLYPISELRLQFRKMGCCSRELSPERNPAPCKRACVADLTRQLRAACRNFVSLMSL